jgi:hypothetical protein
MNLVIDTPEGLGVPAPLVTPVVLLCVSILWNGGGVFRFPTLVQETWWG